MFKQALEEIRDTIGGDIEAVDGKKYNLRSVTFLPDAYPNLQVLGTNGKNAAISAPLLDVSVGARFEQASISWADAERIAALTGDKTLKALARTITVTRNGQEKYVFDLVRVPSMIHHMKRQRSRVSFDVGTLLALSHWGEAQYVAVNYLKSRRSQALLTFYMPNHVAHTETVSCDWHIDCEGFSGGLFDARFLHAIIQRAHTVTSTITFQYAGLIMAVEYLAYIRALLSQCSYEVHVP